MSEQTQTLLVELGCEELPPKALDRLAESFFENTTKSLEEAGISFDKAQSSFFFSPRRMSLRLADVASSQADRVLERKGPAVKAAFDAEGNPTPAAKGFAGSVGLAVEDLDRLETDKGEWLFCRVDVPGKPLSELLFDILQDALNRLPVPKPMRWSDHDFLFVRPVHWLVVLFGDRVLEGSLFGCQAGRLTQGHRIHAPGAHELDHADSYIESLRSAYVLADQDERRAHIQSGARNAGASAGGFSRITDALLAEVNNLVEWPVAVVCGFDEAFLDVPQEALIASMESHQKFFPILTGEDGELTRQFVVIANIESQDVPAMQSGYERVIRPRLADAQFFWEQDLAQDLDHWLDKLDSIVFQKSLGSVGDKTRRIATLAGNIADLSDLDTEAAEHAGRLCKADLVSQMVGEFPELQGIMGGHYARRAGLSTDVADAMADHYQPRFAGDRIPASTTGQLVALADRLDTLVGIFGAGLKPTGNKDPFALRRAALGVIRILEEGAYAMSIDALLDLAAEGLASQLTIDATCRQEVSEFVLERLRNYLLDGGASTRQVNAVLASPLGSLPDLRARLDAVAAFMGRPEADSLIAANKRIGNILKKQDGTISNQIDADLITFEEERQLYEAVKRASRSVEPQFESGEYEAALGTLAGLREVIDGYFDKVMVMDEDPAIRQNRLAQLATLKAMFDRVADFAVAD